MSRKCSNKSAINSFYNLLEKQVEEVRQMARSD